MRLLVMPGLVGVAGFHRRDDMHQAGTVATDDKHPGDDVLLADVVLGNVFDGNASGTRQLGGALAHSIAKRFGKSRIVEDPDLPGRKKSRHSLRVTGSRQRAGDDDPVIAGEHPGEALAVTLRQRLSTSPPVPRVSCVYFNLFGSGFAGLGIPTVAVRRARRAGQRTWSGTGPTQGWRWRACCGGAPRTFG